MWPLVDRREAIPLLSSSKQQIRRDLLTKKPTPKGAADKALEERVVFGGSVHSNFLQQVQELVAESGLSEEDSQKILTNMSCPCCGGNGASFTIKLDDAP
jgi:hypothetical protein